jgi:hypothetical protein
MGASGIETSVSWSALSRRTRPRMAPLRSLVQHRQGSCDPELAIGECAASANRGFTGQGPMASAIDTSRSEPPEGMLAQELRPNPIRSDTSCRGIAAPVTHGHRATGGRLRPCERSHRGPHHPCFREEDRDPPHPRCLPSMCRLLSSSAAEASLSRRRFHLVGVTA